MVYNECKQYCLGGEYLDNNIISKVDKDYMVKIRRELHRYPELGFNLEKTCSLVKKELTKMDIEYTEQYGQSSVVGFINKEKKGITIGIRADMDALPILEQNDVLYKSRYDGKMHACGHDGHTAILLGTAKVLSQIKEKINASVVLIFQPSEEGEASGAKLMVEDGLMDNIDFILGGHLSNNFDVGTTAVRIGRAMAANDAFVIELFGKSGHASLPHKSIDAIAMAFKVFNEIQFISSREIDPFEPKIINIGMMKAGETNNVIVDYAKMSGTIRTHSSDVSKYIVNRIEQICKNTSEEVGGKYNFNVIKSLPPVHNEEKYAKKAIAVMSKIVGEKNVIIPKSPKMSSEDFAFYLTKKPGVFMRWGSRNKDKGFVNFPHSSSWDFDEDALVIGSKVFLQYILDYLNEN